jgi:hypothetical protein
VRITRAVTGSSQDGRSLLRAHRISRARGARASLRARAPLVWFARLSKTSPGSSVVWVGRSRHVVRIHLAVFDTEALALTGRCDLPQAWAPLQSITRDPSRRYARRRQRSREVSCPHDATHSPRSTTPERLPARVTLRPRTYHVPRRLAPSASSLVFFQPGASPGHRPSKHYLTEIAATSRRCFPSCDWHPDRFSRLYACFHFALPRLAVTKTCSSNKPSRPVPLGCMVRTRFRRIGIAARAASLQGLHPSAGWGYPSPDFSTCGALAFMGLLLPGAFPFRASASTVAALPLRTHATTPRA